MPKKPPRNAYYFFMHDFKEEQRLKGINYATLADVAKAADPVWRSSPPSVRAKYEEIAKRAKDKHNVPVAKFASTGVPLAVIEQQEKEKLEALENEIQDIKNIVKTKAFNKDILEEYFYLIDVNYYCKWDNKYLIGESTVLRFNLRDGIRDYYPELINPGQIPIGYASDVKEGCAEFGLEMPDEDSPSNMMDILANIIDFLKQKDLKSLALPPLFTMPDKVLPCKNFLQQMCHKANEDEMIFRVYRLDTLFFHLINSIKANKEEGFPKESLALVQLKKDPFKYTPELACKHHEDNGKAIECTDSRTFRWAYTVLDSCCPVAGIEACPGRHVPGNLDIDRILKFKEVRTVRAVPRVAGFGAASSSCNTSAHESTWEGNLSYAASAVSEPSGAWGHASGGEPSRAWGQPSGSGIDQDPDRESGRRERRTHAPMRMPQADYSRNIRPAPELTEEDFPALTSGLGRGRGLAGSFGRMNINKK
ncbi:unnamed protein product [Spodoptera exigua]|nr:unnamed protein product [Spodoptera exigua]